ncbi:bacteriocin immunity protein [Lactobacillus gallinarum]|uniref:bacteriocin immunity protein n=1 Tax=Lactobacillus gallinarum TaxID=52242 RepID=UPI0017AD507E|nr:bacteriocin immunity protein [Lactobacillus gallinarum]MBM6958951.1 bacteriocin immunity protein [Lactobacillus gallinarum]MCC9271292.1 bacteriocin immunity protein [Lactobacillus gallinarum]MDM8281188.1 bacteriocin immunity protein [Lactobacillus gallinarum]NMB32180.1 bacteriocin immunity protein [Lactobacillus sp.]
MNQRIKSILLSMQTQPDITGDPEAMTIIDHALIEIEQDIDLNKVVFKLNQEIDNYSLTHDFKLPSTLTKLKIMLDENPNKWTEAGLTGSV